MQKYLRMSKKSSTFARFFCVKRLNYYTDRLVKVALG